MSVSYGYIIFVGVQLTDPDGLVSVDDKPVFGCNHEEKEHPFCPKCGAPSKRVVPVNTNKVPLCQDWEQMPEEKVINNMYYVHKFKENDRVYVGVFRKLIYTESYELKFLSSDEVSDYLSECYNMITYLNNNGVHVFEDTVGVYVFPYISV